MEQPSSLPIQACLIVTTETLVTLSYTKNSIESYTGGVFGSDIDPEFMIGIKTLQKPEQVFQTRDAIHGIKGPITSMASQNNHRSSTTVMRRINRGVSGPVCKTLATRVGDGNVTTRAVPPNFTNTNNGTQAVSVQTNDDID